MKKQFISFLGLTKRNMLVYLKDKTTVFFSMLSPLIVLGLYLLFLKDNYINVLIKTLSGFSISASEKDVSPFINSWLICGLLGTSCITVPLSSLTALTYDRENSIDYDFSATPTKKGTILLSYLISSTINTFIISLIILIIGFITLGIQGVFFSFGEVILGIVYLVLGSLSGSSIMMCIVCLFKKNSQVSAFTGIISAASGFLIGAYMPISEYDECIQNIANLLPGSHACGLYRNVLMENALNKVSEIVPIEQGRQAFFDGMVDTFGIKANFFGNTIDVVFMLFYVLITSVLFIGLDIFLFTKTSKRK